MINSYASTDDAEVAIAAAHAGAAVVRSMYGQQLSRTDKGAGDFATPPMWRPRGRSSESSVAAGIAVCRAAGCVVTGIDGGPIGQAGRGLVVAADAETHKLLMSMISSRRKFEGSSEVIRM